jgi:probable O-glycosylation ligase (exosortase A-associated)
MSGPAAVLALVAAACLAALRWPMVGLLAYLWLDFMRPLDIYVELRAVRPMLVLGLVTLAVTAWRERRRLLDGGRRLLPVAALAAVVAVNVGASVDRAQSAWMLLHVGKMLALVWMLDRLVRSEGALRAALWVIVASLGVLALGAIGTASARGLLTEFRPALVIEGPPGLHDGAFRDNNDLARALVLSVPLWWVLAARPRPRWSRWAAAAGLVISVAAIECTFSRGGFVALLVGAAVIAQVYRPLWRSAALWLAFVAALLVLAPRPYLARIATLAAPGADASVQGRLGIWRDGAGILARQPVFGQGAGTFGSATEGTPSAGRASHNILLEVAAELGAVGLAAYAWLVLATLWRLHGLRRTASEAAWLGTAATGIAAALLAYLTAGLALSAPFASPLFVLVGLSLALDRCAATSDS